MFGDILTIDKLIAF